MSDVIRRNEQNLPAFDARAIDKGEPVWQTGEWKKKAFWNFGTLELSVNGLKFCCLRKSFKVPEFHFLFMGLMG